MTPTPKPPTRLTVSGGPKVESHLSVRTIDRPTQNDPYRMAHPSLRTRLSAYLWMALAVLLVVLTILIGVAGGSPR